MHKLYFHGNNKLDNELREIKRTESYKKSENFMIFFDFKKFLSPKNGLCLINTGAPKPTNNRNLDLSSEKNIVSRLA